MLEDACEALHLSPGGSVMGQIKAGKLRALGVTTHERSDTLPDIPPIGDTLPGYETSSFYGVGAPHGTPQEIVDLLNKEINAALADPTIRSGSATSAPSRFKATQRNSSPCSPPKPSAGARWWRCRGRRRSEGRMRNRWPSSSPPDRRCIP